MCIRDRLKAAKRKQRSEQRAWKLSTVLVHSLLIICSLADCAAAAKFLINAGKRRHWPEMSEEDATRRVQDLFLEADVGELAGLTDVDNPSDAEALRTALPYVEQWRLCQWTQALNEQGLAPSTSSVLQRYEEGRAQIPEDVRPRFQGTAADNRGRKWAKLFRRRWGGRHASMKVRALVPSEELRSKAGSCL